MKVGCANVTFQADTNADNQVMNADAEIIVALAVDFGVFICNVVCGERVKAPISKDNAHCFFEFVRLDTEHILSFQMPSASDTSHKANAQHDLYGVFFGTHLRNPGATPTDQTMLTSAFMAEGQVWFVRVSISQMFANTI